MAAKVDAETVVKHALMIEIVPVKLGGKLLEISNDNDCDVLQALRNRYLMQAEIANEERGEDSDRRTRAQEKRLEIERQQRNELKEKIVQDSDFCNVDCNSQLKVEPIPSESIQQDPIPIDREVVNPPDINIDYSNAESSTAKFNIIGDSQGDATLEADVSFDNSTLKPIASKSYVPAFSTENLFEYADETLSIKVAELREAATISDRLFNFNLFMKKWTECLPLLRTGLMHYTLADQMLREALSTGAHIRVISFLLVVSGADPNSQDLYLYTPLHIASVHNRPDAVRLLLLCGADPTVVGALGSSSRGLIKSPADLISNRSHVNMNIAMWPAALVVLRGKACIHCYSLCSSSVKCFHCRLSLCTVCATRHWCIQQFLKEEFDESIQKLTSFITANSLESVEKTPSAFPQGRVGLSGGCNEDKIQYEQTTTWSPSLIRRCDASEVADFPHDTEETEFPDDLVHKMVHVLSDKEKFTFMSSTPVYWVGFRGIKRKGPQPWQKLLLPLLFDSRTNSMTEEQNESVYEVMEDCQTDSADNISDISRDANNVRDKKYQTNRLMYSATPLGEPKPSSSCIFSADGCNSTLKFWDQFTSAHGETAAYLSPRFLYLRDEINQLQCLLERDSTLFFSPESKGLGSTLQIIEKDNDSTDSTFLGNGEITDPSATSSSCAVKMSCSDVKSDKKQIIPELYSRLSDLGVHDEILQVPERDELKKFAEDSGWRLGASTVLLNRAWAIKEDHPLWVPDDVAWSCRQCHQQFSIFLRKHHCRRCGGLFCDAHAPLISLTECLSSELLETNVDPFLSPNISDVQEKNQARMCNPCKFELQHARGVYKEIMESSNIYSFSYWQEVLFDFSPSQLPENVDIQDDFGSDEDFDDVDDNFLESSLCEALEDAPLSEKSKVRFKSILRHHNILLLIYTFH